MKMFDNEKESSTWEYVSGSEVKKDISISQTNNDIKVLNTGEKKTFLLQNRILWKKTLFEIWTFEFGALEMIEICIDVIFPTILTNKSNLNAL